MIFSHSHKRDDLELRPSSLITDIYEIQADSLELSSYTSLKQILLSHQKIDSIEDNKAPAVSSTEKIRGGISIFKLQALCPFRAFAEIRLHAKPLDELILGIKPQERGSIIHKALELIWLEIKNSQKLKELSIDQLKETIHIQTNNAMETVTNKKNNQKRYLALEFKRITNLLYRWFEIELQRPEFKVLHLEHEQEIEVNGLTIKLRADRIDELESGQRMIIDYKTGKNNEIKHWFDTRIDEPQLPLYCLSLSNTTSISYAKSIQMN